MHAVSGVRCSDHRHGWKVRRSHIAPRSRSRQHRNVAYSSRAVMLTKTHGTTGILATAAHAAPPLANERAASAPHWRCALSVANTAKTRSIQKGLDKAPPHGRRGGSPIPESDP